MYSSTIFLTFALDGGGWATPSSGRFTTYNDAVPIVQEAAWAPGPIWTVAENLVPNGIRSPDRLACSAPLCRLRYPGPTLYVKRKRDMKHEGIRRIVRSKREVKKKTTMDMTSVEEPVDKKAQRPM